MRLLHPWTLLLMLILVAAPSPGDKVQRLEQHRNDELTRRERHGRKRQAGPESPVSVLCPSECRIRLPQGLPCQSSDTILLLHLAQCIRALPAHSLQVSRAASSVVCNCTLWDLLWKLSASSILTVVPSFCSALLFINCDRMQSTENQTVPQADVSYVHRENYSPTEAAVIHMLRDPVEEYGHLSNRITNTVFREKLRQVLNRGHQGSTKEIRAHIKTTVVNEKRKFLSDGEGNAEQNNSQNLPEGKTEIIITTSDENGQDNMAKKQTPKGDRNGDVAKKIVKRSDGAEEGKDDEKNKSEGKEESEKKDSAGESVKEGSDSLDTTATEAKEGNVESNDTEKATSTNVNETETTSTNVNETETKSTNGNETETTSTNVNETETSTNVNETETTSTNGNETETTSTNVTETETASTNVTETETTSTHVNETETTSTNVNETETTSTHDNETETTSENGNETEPSKSDNATDTESKSDKESPHDNEESESEEKEEASVIIIKSNANHTKTTTENKTGGEAHHKPAKANKIHSETTENKTRGSLHHHKPANVSERLNVTVENKEAGTVEQIVENKNESVSQTTKNHTGSEVKEEVAKTNEKISVIFKPDNETMGTTEKDSNKPKGWENEAKGGKKGGLPPKAGMPKTKTVGVDVVDERSDRKKDQDFEGIVHEEYKNEEEDSDEDDNDDDDEEDEEDEEGEDESDKALETELDEDDESDEDDSEDELDIEDSDPTETASDKELEAMAKTGSMSAIYSTVRGVKHSSKSKDLADPTLAAADYDDDEIGTETEERPSSVEQQFDPMTVGGLVFESYVKRSADRHRWKRNIDDKADIIFTGRKYGTRLHPIEQPIAGGLRGGTADVNES